MNEKSKAIADLVQKHLNDDLNHQEKQELDNWLQESEENRLFFEHLTDEKSLSATLSEYEVSKDIVYGKIKKAIPLNGEKKKKATRIAWLSPRRITAIAASILVVSGALVWWSINSSPGKETSTVPASQRDRQPAFAGAILKLADGQEIILDDAKDGTVAKEGNTQITKQGGLLLYNSNDPSNKVLYNTLSTPKGRVYKLSLPDGSKAWLNAASSIRFPAAFSGKERQVEISGEVYFEVKQNKEMPFYVKVDQFTTIEVLGTEFNVNAYDNEKFLRTTLLTGSIRVQNKEQEQKGNSVLLKPGQQAQWKNVETVQTITVVQNVNIEKVTGWKDGFFSFDDLTLEELMREVERWYDVEVVYEKGIPAKAFFGKVSRNLSLLDFMEGLKDWGVRFRLEGRKLIITGVD